MVVLNEIREDGERTVWGMERSSGWEWVAWIPTPRILPHGRFTTAEMQGVSRASLGGEWLEDTSGRER